MSEIVENSNAARQPETVWELLANSLEDAAPIFDEGSYNKLYAIKSPDGMFDDYLIRVPRLNTHAGARMRKTTASELRSSTALVNPSMVLSIPDFMFVGPKVSQALLHYGMGKDGLAQIEIIHKHAGRNIHERLTEAVDYHAVTDIMQKLQTPGTIDGLMEQVAFIGLQTHSQGHLDPNSWANLMLEDNGKATLVDIVSQETIDRHAKAHEPIKTDEAAIRSAQNARCRLYVDRLSGALQAIADHNVRGAAVPLAQELHATYRRFAPPALKEKIDLSATAIFSSAEKPFIDLQTWASRTTHLIRQELTKEQRPAFEQALAETEYARYIEAQKHFVAAVEASEKRVIDWLDDGNIREVLAEEHPKWKGFMRAKKPEGETTVQLPETIEWEVATTYGKQEQKRGGIRARTVDAVSLADTPQTLKIALDRLYKEAVPERA